MRRSTLYLRARERFRELDPNITKRGLAALTHAAIERGLVLADRDGEPVFVRTEVQSR
jgi:hypothetical protein